MKAKPNNSPSWMLCPQCGQRKRGFWASQYELPCDDCRAEDIKREKEERLKSAVASRKVKITDLTPLGRKVCGLD